MTVINLELDGLSIEISHPAIELHKRKIGVSVKFQCTGCGRRDLEITAEEIRRAGAYTDSSGKAHLSIFDSARNGFELAKQRKEIEDNDALDFISYIKELSVWRRRNEARFDFAGNGGQSELSIICPLCGTKHSLTVVITNPVDAELGEPDLIETWKKRGIKNNANNFDLLEEICAKSLPYSEHGEDFLVRLEQLHTDLEKIGSVKGEIGATIQKAKFESEEATRWLHDLEASFSEVTRILEKKLEESLKASLELIEGFATSPLPEEVA